MINFTETHRERLDRDTINYTTQGDETHSLLLVALDDDEAYSLDILVSACQVDQFGKLPPKFQSLETKQIVYLQQGKARFVVRQGADCYKVELEPPPLWAQLGHSRVFPAVASLRCKDKEVILDIQGGEFIWTVNVRGAKYQGTYR